MSPDSKLSDPQWFKIRAFLRTHPRAYVGDEESCRLFIEAVLWITRAQVQWRSLPEDYGYWNSVYKRFARWCDHGVWEAMQCHFAGDPDMKTLILERIVIQAGS